MYQKASNVGLALRELKVISKVNVSKLFFAYLKRHEQTDKKMNGQTDEQTDR
jgi:hypothetical protein